MYMSQTGCETKQVSMGGEELGGIPGPILRIEIEQICRRDEVSRIRDKNLSESGQTQSSYAEIDIGREANPVRTPSSSNSRTSWRRAPNGSRKFLNTYRALSQIRISENGE